MNRSTDSSRAAASAPGPRRAPGCRSAPSASGGTPCRGRARSRPGRRHRLGRPGSRGRSRPARGRRPPGRHRRRPRAGPRHRAVAGPRRRRSRCGVPARVPLCGSPGLASMTGFPHIRPSNARLVPATRSRLTSVLPLHLHFREGLPELRPATPGALDPPCGLVGPGTKNTHPTWVFTEAGFPTQAGARVRRVPRARTHASRSPPSPRRTEPVKMSSRPVETSRATSA